MSVQTNKYLVWRWHLQVACSAELSAQVNSSHSKVSSLIILSSPQRFVRKPDDDIPDRCAIPVKHGFDFDKLSGLLKMPYMVGGSDSAVAPLLVLPTLIRFSLNVLPWGVIQASHHTFSRKEKKKKKSSPKQCSVLLKAVWGKDLVSRTG